MTLNNPTKRNQPSDSPSPDEHAAKARGFPSSEGDPTKIKSAQNLSGHENLDTDVALGYDPEMGEFEDAFEDEYESDSDVIMNEDGPDADVDMNDEDAPQTDNVQVYLPGQPLAEGEELVVDHSAYHMLHALNLQWPCLSFDILKDQHGIDRKKFPHTAYMVAGSQAEHSFKNELYVLKMSQLSQTKYDDMESGDESDNDDNDEVMIDMDPILEYKIIKHPGGVNRIRAMPTDTESQIVAVWSDTRQVNIYDISVHYQALDKPGLIAPTKVDPLYKISHPHEGFAMDWSRRSHGHLMTGDCDATLKHTVMTPSGFETISNIPRAHSLSIEDIQWSPVEPTVFASCSADGTMKIFDTRIKATGTSSGAAISATLAQCDVNVISWNQSTPFLVASGHDDGSFAIWDLRHLQSINQSNTTITPQPAAQFKWHKAPITSIQWHTHEESMLAVSGDDHQVTLWDLSTEHDDAPGHKPMGVNGLTVPPQLLFIHQGQQFVKEIHWHPQIPGCLVTTAASGFNILKTINS